MRRGHKWDLIVIGGGVVGSSIALEAARRKLKTLVLEKENDVACGISKANSGVVHAGFYVPPRTLKAHLNVEGARLLPEMCRSLKVPYRRCGKLVIARDEAERSELEHLRAQGRENGCTELAIVGRKRIRSIAPYVEARWALHSPGTGVLSPLLLTVRIAEKAHDTGARFRFGERVEVLLGDRGGILVETADGNAYSADRVVNAAGLGALELALRPDPGLRWRMYPYRGQYLVLDSRARHYVPSAIYPVPPKSGKGLGVHLTPTTNGAVLIGPSTELVRSADDTSNTRDTIEEMRRAAGSMVPQLRDIETIKIYAGIRPKLVGPDEEGGFEDFQIFKSPTVPGLVNLLGIESPGLTAAPAIAGYVMELLEVPEANARSRCRTNGKADRGAAAEHPREIVCHCQSITRGEIVAALRNPFNARSIAAIRKRTDAGMGTCQGQFCLPRIIRILRDDAQVETTDIVLDGAGTNPIVRDGKS